MLNYLQIIVLIFAIFEIQTAQSRCDSEVCDNVCHNWSMNGTCVGDDCRCSTDKPCLDFVCDKVCDVLDLHLEGECDDNGMCTCKPKLDPCAPTECQEQCEEDPRAKYCIFVVADFCLWYGPIRTCGCICYQWYNQPFKYFIKSQPENLNLSVSPAKKSSRLHRYYYQIN